MVSQGYMEGTMMADVEVLRKVLLEASEAKNNLDMEVSDRRRIMIQEVDRVLEVEYGERLRVAREASNRAQEALTLFLNEEALSKAVLPYPEGTVMEEWRSVRGNGWNRTVCEPYRTGKKGVLVLVRERLHGRSRWREASPGSVVVRFLRKDGTPGVDFERWEEKSSEVWKLEEKEGGAS